ARRARETRVLGAERPRPPALARRLPAARARGLVGGYQLPAATPDQVGAPHAPERLAQQRPVVGIVVAQERLVQTAHLEALRDQHRFARARDALQGIPARVIHGGGGGHRAWQEGLHLVGAKPVLLQPQRQLLHVLLGGAGVRGDEVGDQILLLAGLLRVAVEQLLETVV